MLTTFRMDEAIKSKAAMKLTFTAAAAKVMYTKAVLLKEGLVKVGGVVQAGQDDRYRQRWWQGRGQKGGGRGQAF